MLWYEITARTPPNEVEAVVAIMQQTAPGGLSIDEPVDILGPEQGFRVRRGEAVLVRCYVPASELGAVLTEDLRRAMQAIPSVELTAKPLYEEDWAVSWREFFGVVDSGGRVVIVPSWLEHDAAPGQLVIHLDPGQAFGTGHHETTRLCLTTLEEHVAPGYAVLDVGTGSGVLAMAAVLLGAERVTAIDIDPVAVEVARRNCDENGVGERVTVATGTLKPDHPGRYDLVVSNISTAANTALAEAFAAVLRPGGRLILSGILGVDAEGVRNAMRIRGLSTTAVRYERDWCCIELVQ
jgi:ribosomal protein L11 methyltransferase